MIRKVLKWFGILLIVAVAGLFAWGYAPDIPVSTLKAKYGNGESEFVKLDNGLTVHLRDEGPKDAPAIILLHGSNASLHTWEQWTERLKGQYRIIRFDQIGHGLTGPDPKDCYSTACFVDTVERVAANRGLTKFYLGGNSMGGFVTHEYAKAHPARLLGLILVDASGAPDAAPKSLPIGFRIARLPVLNQLARVITPRSIIERSLQQSVSNQKVVTAAEVDEYWELLRRPGNREATGKRFAQYAGRDIGAPVPAATAALPALILWGEKDTLIPVKAVNWFQTSYAKNVTHIYQNIGHLPMEEAPVRTAEDVRSWLADQVR